MPAVEVDELRRSPTASLVAVDGLALTAEAGRGHRPARAERGGQDLHHRGARGLPSPGRRARAGAWGTTRWPTTPRSVPRIGVMLQAGGVLPGLRAGEVVRPLRGAVRTGGRTPTRCSPGWVSPSRAQGHGPPPLRRPAATPVAGPGAGGAARGGLPGRAHRGGGRAGPPARAGRRPGAARPPGSCVLLTTHELEEAERVADQVRDRGPGHRGGRRAPSPSCDRCPPATR